MKEIFSHLDRLTGNSLSPQYRTLSEGEVFKIVLNSEKACRVLGWEPTVSLEEGLSRTVDSFRT